jgi:hypothetical protein
MVVTKRELQKSVARFVISVKEAKIPTKQKKVAAIVTN